MNHSSQKTPPFIVEYNRQVDCRVIYGKPLPTDATSPTVVNAVHDMNKVPSAPGSHVIEKACKNYMPYTNSNEAWKVLDLMFGDNSLSCFEISNQGRVRRRDTQMLVSLFLSNETGQVIADFGRPPSRLFLPIDTLVCQIFCMHTLNAKENPNVVVHHRDGNRLNNHADNLEFMQKHIHEKKVHECQPLDHTVVLDGRLYHHFGARLAYFVSRESTRQT